MTFGFPVLNLNDHNGYKILSLCFKASVSVAEKLMLFACLNHLNILELLTSFDTYIVFTFPCQRCVDLDRNDQLACIMC